MQTDTQADLTRAQSLLGRDVIVAGRNLSVPMGTRGRLSSYRVLSRVGGGYLVSATLWDGAREYEIHPNWLVSYPPSLED